MNRRYFGTDGIRGRVGELPITADFMLRLGWAAGRVFSAAGSGQILIGKDTRVSGYLFESWRFNSAKRILYKQVIQNT